MSTFPLNTDQPEISEHPHNQIVLEGLNVSFLCNASGNPTPTFSWTINGSPVNTTSNPRITFSAYNKQLTITTVKRTDGGEALDWFCSYLSDRTQYVRIQDVSSDVHALPYVVPQGSVLGPLLYSLYTSLLRWYCKISWSILSLLCWWYTAIFVFWNIIRWGFVNM